MKARRPAGLDPASTLLICTIGMLAASCSERKSAQQSNANVSPIVQRAENPEPPLPVVHRSGRQVVQLIQATCIRAADESATVQRFEAILKERGLNPMALPGHGRMSVWQFPGANIRYANSPKGGFAQDILCELNFDPRGTPKADRVATSLKPLLGKGDPQRYRTVQPSGPLGYRWEYSSVPGERAELTIGDMPELCDHELGCTPAVLAVRLSHSKDPVSR